ncbi:MAG: OmpA family protein [Clostridium sp.]|nr:OmpA family protein [Clostridium sp.]
MKYLALILSIAVCLAMHAQKGVDISELSLTENLQQPAVSGKALKPIQAHMEKIRTSLGKHFQAVELVRDGQVIIVDIPASTLFAPNETALLESGKPFLRPFLNMLKYPTMYKLLAVMHSDDTGDDQYAYELTSERAAAVQEFLCEESGQDGSNVVAYGVGKEDPAAPNNSMASRAANRRLELYIVPQWQLVDQAKSGKLK